MPKKLWKVIAVAIVAVCLTLAVYVLATTFKYVYPAESVIAQTDGYSGSTPDLANDQSYDYTADIDMETNGYYGCWVTLEHDSSGTTDNIIISYFSSYDGTNFDDVELWSVVCDATTGTDTQISFLVCPSPPHGRIGVKTSGTTNTFDYQITILPFSGSGAE